MIFEHNIELSNDTIYFAFTYPYTYEMVQNDLNIIDELNKNINMNDNDSIYCTKELVINSIDGLRVDLITITSVSGVSNTLERERTFPGLFPLVKEDKKDSNNSESHGNEESDDDDDDDDEESEDDEGNENKKNIVEIKRPFIFPEKEIVFISARVHPGEVCRF